MSTDQIEMGDDPYDSKRWSIDFELDGERFSSSSYSLTKVRAYRIANKLRERGIGAKPFDNAGCD